MRTLLIRLATSVPVLTSDGPMVLTELTHGELAQA
jgi:hypothetical protein